MEVAKPKKRKATRPVVVKLEPVQKKAKRSLSETDEEWQKYVKQKTTKTAVNKESSLLASKKKEGSVVATTTAAATTTTTTNNQKKKKKKVNPLLKPREACDLMRNEQRVQALARNVEIIENINETNCEQKTLAVHVMPARARQTYDTLSLNADNAANIVYNDVDFCMEMKRHNYERITMAKSLPLQDLMGDHGFLPINNENIDQTVECIIKANRADIAYAKHSQMENLAAAASSSAAYELQKKKVTHHSSSNNGGVGGDASNKKLNCISGGVFYSYGYTKRKPQNQSKKLNSDDVLDREQRAKEFFLLDQLESETNFGELPSSFKMFRTIEKENLEKYTKRNEAIGLTGSLMPKTDIEIVSREYIAAFREPPVEGEETCANKERCIFNTFSEDKNVSYIGKVFFTEKERARGSPIGNTHRLCIDCLLSKWTIEWVLNVRHEEIPERPINYFSVIADVPGQYSSHCMLAGIENDIPTGITGHVPRFSHNNRRFTTASRHLKRDGKYYDISVPVLEETGVDF